MPNYAKLAKGLTSVLKGTQDVLPAAEREANLAKFLAGSKDQRRMYHGNQADIGQFIPSHKGVFVSPNPDFASKFSEGATGRHGPNVMPVRVQVKNPFDYDNPAHMKAIREAANKRFPGNTSVRYTLDELAGIDDSGGNYNNWASIEHPDIQRLIKELGHDAYYTSEEGVKNLGIYDPKRIKSDIGNKGTYDVNKGDINEAKGGLAKIKRMARGGDVSDSIMSEPDQVSPDYVQPDTLPLVAPDNSPIAGGLNAINQPAPAVTPVVDSTSTGYQYASSEGGIGLDKYYQNIQDWLSSDHTPEETAQAQQKWGVSDDDIAKAKSMLPGLQVDVQDASTTPHVETAVTPSPSPLRAEEPAPLATFSPQEFLSLTSVNDATPSQQTQTGLKTLHDAGYSPEQAAQLWNQAYDTNFTAEDYRRELNNSGIEKVDNPQLAVFGDSISSVIGYTPDGNGSGYADTTNGINLAQYLGNDLKVYSTNNSMGGVTSQDSLNGTPISYNGQQLPLEYGNYAKYIEDHKPEVAVLRYGAADAIKLNDPEATLKNIESMVNIANDNGTKPILVGVTPMAKMGDFNAGNINAGITDGMIANADAINAGIKELAKKYGVQFVDVRQVPVPKGALLDGVHQSGEYGASLAKYISDQIKMSNPLTKALHAKKGGAIRMQVGGLSTLAKLGQAGTKLTKAEMAALRARGMGVPGIDFADPLAAPSMRMSEALGNAGAEGKWLNFTEADRSRVFGPNKGGTGFSALQHYSEPHKEARTVWGFGNKSTAEKKIRQNDPENTIWTTYAGSPEQHKSNTVVVKDAVKTLQDANAKGAVHPEQVRLINERIRQATSDKGAPLFPSDFDITDPQAISLATTFDRRTAISDALMGTGVKKPMISKEFKQANPGVQWNDASDISRILTRETDPALANANTFDVGPHLFTMENKIIHRPDLNEAFPVQVTGDDLGMRFKPAPFRTAAPEFIKEKGYGPNDPINAWAVSRGNPRQFVDEKYLTGMQKEGHKDGGSVQPSFTQRLNAAIESHMASGGEPEHMAKGGNIHMPVRSLRGLKPRRYADAGSVEPLGAPDYQTNPQDSRMMELAGRMIKDQAKKEGAVLSTPEGRRDIALKVASHMPGLGMGGDLMALADWVQTLIPGMYSEKPTSVLDTKKAAAPYRDVRELQRVPKFPLRNVIGSPTGEEFQEKFKEMGIQGENEAPVSEFVGSMLTPGAIAKIPKAPRAIEGGLNSVTAAARRPFTPATATVEAVSPDLAKFKNQPFQDYTTKQMIGEGAAVPMTTMGGRKTSQKAGQGAYLNEAGELEYNPMLGVNIPRAGNLSKNKALRADIATAGQELGQEAMAAHRFVPMMTNQIKDASAMMIKGPGGRPLTNEQVKALANELPGMIATHSPANGGLLVAPFGMTKGQVPEEFLTAQSVARKILGKDAKVQFGKADEKKDLMYMPRSTYVEEGGRGTSAEVQAIRNKLKRMDKNFATQ